ncbi:MAG: DMT family transporter, partial [Chloroflexota bacterium]
PSLYIAMFRLIGAAAVLTLPTLMRHRNELSVLNRRQWGLATISGMFLAAHFAFWNLSLEYTTVLVSVTLVSTTPLFAALSEWLFLRQLPRNVVLIGMVFAIGGGILLAIPVDISNVSASTSGDNDLLGGVLALLGAVAMAAYLTIGRSLRANLALLPYIWIVYGIGGLVMLPVLFAQDVPLTGYSVNGYLWLIALALIPQLIGHSSLNYAVKYLSATYISVTTKLEPIVSAAIAFFAFSEIPNRWEITGSAIILTGVLVASLPKRNRMRASKPIGTTL